MRFVWVIVSRRFTTRAGVTIQVRSELLARDGGRESSTERPDAIAMQRHETSGKENDNDTCAEQQATVDGPLRLPGHEAPRQQVHALKEPDTAHEQANRAD